jgi:cell division protein FtsI (penicillin-binding protein 3)
VEDYSRIYPYGSLASHVLGFTDRNLDGVSGIESQFNKYLTGQDGIKFIENDVQGRLVTFNPENSREPQSGNNIELTINKNYQLILEEELNKGLKKFKGESAVGIIMDPNTGEIMAWANQPDFDPSNYNLYSDQLRRNRAITDTYEPGSTIKPLIMSILLEENLTQEREIINTENGKYKIRGAIIRDTHQFDKLTSSGIISHSSNVGMAKLSDRIDEDTFYRYLRDYGFGNLTSIDLPGETNGMLKKPKNYSSVSKKFISFGYEIGVTPLQLITAYCALVNGGDLLQPFVVKSIVNNKGQIIESFKRNKIRSVISEKTSKRVTEMMKEVVEEGSGIEAKLSNVQVAGKTGTSQRLINNEYSSSSYNSSFVGFFPAENPKYISLIVVKAPKIGKYGGKVAAPIFHEVASRIVDSDKTIINDDNYNSISKTAKYAYNEIEENRIFITSDLANEDSEITVERKVKYNGDLSSMPNLTNYTKRDAIKIMNDLGIKYQIVGSGTVVSQSIKAGTRLDGKTVCNLNCSTKKTNSKLRIN